MLVRACSEILEWKKIQSDTTIQQRKIDAEKEKSRDWTRATQSGMIERTLVENMQRKQGALDVYEAVISLIEQRKGVGKLKKEEKGVYESLLAEIKAIKHGLNNFPLGFHEQVERERKGGRGRFRLVQESKEETEKETVKEKEAKS